MRLGRFFVVMIVFALCAPAEAQQPGKIPWIGYLAGAGSGPSPAFIQGLRHLCSVEGKNIGFVYRTAEGESGRYADIAAELVRLQVDIIVAADSTGMALTSPGPSARIQSCWKRMTASY